MEKYLIPEDDGLAARPSGQWVTEKLHYLKRYIYMFETSMRNKPWRRRNYIDLFAGPGKCIINQTSEFHLGSPLLALTTEHPFTDYYFVDADQRNINLLKERCSASLVSADVHYFAGDSNATVQTIVDQIVRIDRSFIKGHWPSISLAFLDPEGLELEWSTVSTLAQAGRMDLIIHYSQNGLTRNLEICYNAADETIIDRFFGDGEWRIIYQDWKNKKTRFGIHRQLIDYYKSKLQGLGYVEVLRDDETGAEPLIRNSRRKAPLYRLIFASKHELGHDFWRSVTRKDVHGQQRLF